jgi:hypothetical protein
MDGRGKITAASLASDQIMDEVEKARAHLRGPWLANGYGVFTDHSDVRAAIRSSIERLTAALGVIAATDWPTPADYDASEDV